MRNTTKNLRRRIKLQKIHNRLAKQAKQAKKAAREASAAAK
ncbi:MAG TPA: hypothetical protein VEB41_08775 [Burkholderiales bacterium]|nr:hypothetical protein [Burkholderiales bacterium]